MSNDGIVKSPVPITVSNDKVSITVRIPRHLAAAYTQTDDGSVNIAYLQRIKKWQPALISFMLDGLAQMGRGIAIARGEDAQDDGTFEDLRAHVQELHIPDAIMERAKDEAEARELAGEPSFEEAYKNAFYVWCDDGVWTMMRKRGMYSLFNFVYVKGRWYRA